MISASFLLNSLPEYLRRQEVICIRMVSCRNKKMDRHSEGYAARTSSSPLCPDAVDPACGEILASAINLVKRKGKILKMKMEI